MTGTSAQTPLDWPAALSAHEAEIIGEDDPGAIAEHTVTAQLAEVVARDFRRPSDAACSEAMVRALVAVRALGRAQRIADDATARLPYDIATLTARREITRRLMLAWSLRHAPDLAHLYGERLGRVVVELDERRDRIAVR